MQDGKVRFLYLVFVIICKFSIDITLQEIKCSSIIPFVLISAQKFCFIRITTVYGEWLTGDLKLCENIHSNLKIRIIQSSYFQLLIESILLSCISISVSFIVGLPNIIKEFYSELAEVKKMDPDEVEKIRFLVIPFSPVSFVVHNIDQLQERKLHYIGHVSRRGYEKNSKNFSKPAAN